MTASRAQMHVDTTAIGSLGPTVGAHNGPWRAQQAASPDMSGDEGGQPHTEGGECEWSRRGMFYSEHGGMLSRHFRRRTSSAHMLNPTPLYLSPTHVHHTPARSHSCAADRLSQSAWPLDAIGAERRLDLDLRRLLKAVYLRTKGQPRCHREPDLFPRSGVERRTSAVGRLQDGGRDALIASVQLRGLPTTAPGRRRLLHAARSIFSSMPLPGHRPIPAPILTSAMDGYHAYTPPVTISALQRPDASRMDAGRNGATGRE
jgi:hypothetical protein